VPAKIVTTGALFVSCALSWPIFLSYVAGHAEPSVAPVLHWLSSGSFNAAWALRVDTLTAVMLVVVTSVSALVHLYSLGLHGRGPGSAALLRLSVALHLRHADAGDGDNLSRCSSAGKAWASRPIC
jgi:formate hydrogenlyase subunit 3/multisubunit Na+/H+ antiporter MnhD subunit